jgi:hypothetical protein
MSQTISGDIPKTKRVRAPRAKEDMGVERDIGRIEGALKAHEDRMDRSDAAHAAQFKTINDRFDGIKQHLNGQDEKLDILIAKSNREAGESGMRRRVLSFGGWFLGVVAVIVAALIEARSRGG